VGREFAVFLSASVLGLSQQAAPTSKDGNVMLAAVSRDESMLTGEISSSIHCCPVKYLANSNKSLAINRIGGNRPKNDLN
jgi:hypothetical protein